jgi:AraC-like DNA-binding protein
MAQKLFMRESRPGYSWTVQELAERAGMSRSAFAARFKAQVGTSVMEYLIRWRMLLAADRLVNSLGPISSIALSLGHESESALGSRSREG